MLAPGPSARIVLSHLNGAAFVRKEKEDNPTTVRSTMPDLATLEAVAGRLGLQASWLEHLRLVRRRFEASARTLTMRVFLRRAASSTANEPKTGHPGSARRLKTLY